MAEWEEFNASNLFPDQLAALVGPASSLSDTLGQTLSTVSTVVDIAAQFAGGFSDPNKALVETTQGAISDATGSLTGTDVFRLRHVPSSPAQAVGIEAWINDVALSFDDTADLNRPIIEGDQTYIGVSCLVVGADSYKELMTQFAPFFRLFGQKIPDDEQLDNLPNSPSDVRPIGSGIGKAPDWENTDASKIAPSVGVVSDEFEGFNEQVQASPDATEQYQKFSSLLNTKATVLLDFATTANTALDDVTAATEFDGGWILPIYGQGDKSFIQRELLQSTGGPRDQAYKFAAGMVFLSAGGTSAPRDAMFDFFKLPKIDT